jgi:protease-4
MNPADNNRGNANGPRRGLGCLFIMMISLVVLGIVGASLAGFAGGIGPEEDRLSETVVKLSPEAKQKLVVVEVRGALMPSGGSVASGVSSAARKMLKRALKDEDVAGVMLLLDTPGGSVTESDILHHEIGRLRKAGKEVLVLMGDMCASGGYYAAVAANRIWALPTTITGSIGVIINSFTIEQLLVRMGVVDQSIASGKNKAILNPMKSMSDEQRGLLQSMVDQLYDRFVGLIVEGRKLEDEKVRALADGRLLTADEALKAKLIDSIGYEEDALAELVNLAGGGPFNIVKYSVRPSLLESISARASAGSLEYGALRTLLAAPRPLYLYSPLGVSP